MYGADYVHTVVGKFRNADERSRPNDGDQGTRGLAVDPLCYDHSGEHTCGDPERPPVELAQLVENVPYPADRRRATPRQAEDGRDLLDEDLYADPGEHARHHRKREEISDPAEPEQPGRYQESSNDQRSCAHQMRVGCRASGS